MTKGDVDRLRQMRESRFTERGRPAKVDAKPPKPRADLKPAKAAPHVATKRKKVVAEAIGKAREGKAQLSIWIDMDLMRDINIAVAEDGVSKTAWMECVLREAIGSRGGRG